MSDYCKEIPALLYRFLTALQERDLADTAKRRTQRFDDRLAGLLQEMQDHMPGVAGAILLSSKACSRPEAPVCSDAWDRRVFDDGEKLAKLADYLDKNFERRPKGAEYHTRTANDPEEFKWLAQALRTGRPSSFGIIPLKVFVPPGLGMARAVSSLLVVAFDNLTPKSGGAVDQPYRKELEFLGWVITHLSINWESAGLARRYDHLTRAIHHGVGDVLTQKQPVAGRASEFSELVERIREHMRCDSCQLYLLPEYTDSLKEKDPECIWLIDEAVAPSKPLKHGWGDHCLVSHIWRAEEDTPLKEADLLRHPVYGKYALGPLGLSRCVLGLLLWSSNGAQPIGVILLRDKHALDDQGLMRIEVRGFDEDTKERLTARARPLVGVLERCHDLSDKKTRGSVVAEVDQIRSAFSADRCELYLTPEFRGRRKGDDGTSCMELYCRCRRSWCGDAFYARGEGITGQVFESGKLRRIDDGLLKWMEVFKKEDKSRKAEAGKYRLSQHLIAVPISEPVQLRDAGAPGKTIGVLKIRDRLNRNEDALSTEGFSQGDERLLEAFAQMISVRIGNRRSAQLRERGERERNREMAHTYRHVVGNFTLGLTLFAGVSGAELPEDYLIDANRLTQMLNRSLVAAQTAANQRGYDEQESCDLQAVWAGLFPKGSLSTDSTCKVRATLRSETKAPAKGTLVKCDRTLLEVAILTLPTWMYDHAQPLPAKGEEKTLTVKVVVEERDRSVHIVLLPSLPMRFPAEGEDEDNAVPNARPISYPKCLISPPVSWEALTNQLGRFGVSLRRSEAEDKAQIWIDIPRVLEDSEGGGEPAD